MPQVTLFAPDITCDHCIATIQRTVDAHEGARFVTGDPESASFVVEVERGEVLDTLAGALASEGYPLGEPSNGPTVSASGMAFPIAGHTPAAAPSGFRPRLRVEKTAAGADVHYNCNCGSEDEVFHFDRSKPEQTPHSCCNHHMLVEPNAGERLRTRMGEGYTIDVQSIDMPWGQSMEAAFAVAK
jgi:copper chaperone CopZ